MKKLIWLLAVALWLAGPMGHADVIPSRLADDAYIFEFGGSGSSLPVGGSITPAQAIAHAYTMPAVRQAIELMVSRGYVAYPLYDEAVVSASPPLTMVCLSFEKPGLVPPPGHQGTPLVMVGTTVADYQPVTAVSGGIAFVNMQTAEFFTADSLLEYRLTDGSFDIPAAGSEGDLKDPLVHPEMLGATNSPGDKKFRRWVYCFSAGSLGMLTTIVTTTPPIPQALVTRLVIQHILLAAGCAAAAVGL